MTTYQDPPPQSRRAARNSERADSVAPAVGVEQSGDMWDTTARRAASLPQAVTAQAPTAQSVAPQAVAPPSSAGQPTGRRAAPAPVGEPLGYVTQQRPVETPQFRPRGTTPPPSPEALPPTEALPQVDQPMYRVRDYSPEGRRAAQAAPVAAPEWTQPYDPLHPEDADLGYQTERRAPAQPIAEVPPTIGMAAPASPVPPQAAPPPVSEVPPAVAPERTLSRREMRALIQAEAEAAPSPSGPLPLVAPEPKITTGLTNAISEFDALMARAAAAGPVPTAPAFPQPVAPAPAPPAPAAVAPEGSAAEAAAPAWPQQVDLPAEPPVESLWPQAARDEVSPPDVPQLAEPPRVVDEPAPWTPRAGHWSSQLDQDDDEVPETTVNRTIGSATLTTNALVLPTTPDGDIRGPLTSTGEILLTGSIDLPLSLASTGVSGRIENSGMDLLFETHDAESVSTDSAPVSAIRAVSTQSGSGLNHAPKPKGNRALTALLIAAVSMGVVVVGLFGLALALGAFS